MGATNFTSIGHGKSAGEAFKRLQDAARYEDGHGGYTGTIAEKPGAILVNGGEAMTYKQAQRLIGKLESDYGEYKVLGNTSYDLARVVYKTPEGARYGEAYHDKWGPALAIQIKRSTVPDYIKQSAPARGVEFWLFAGYASS